MSEYKFCDLIKDKKKGEKIFIDDLVTCVHELVIRIEKIEKHTGLSVLTAKPTYSREGQEL